MLCEYPRIHLTPLTIRVYLQYRTLHRSDGQHCIHGEPRSCFRCSVNLPTMHRGSIMLTFCHEAYWKADLTQSAKPSARAMWLIVFKQCDFMFAVLFSNCQHIASVQLCAEPFRKQRKQTFAHKYRSEESAHGPSWQNVAVYFYFGFQMWVTYVCQLFMIFPNPR